MGIQCDHIRLKHGLACFGVKGSKVVFPDMDQ